MKSYNENCKFSWLSAERHEWEKLNTIIFPLCPCFYFCPDSPQRTVIGLRSPLAPEAWARLAVISRLWPWIQWNFGELLFSYYAIYQIPLNNRQTPVDFRVYQVQAFSFLDCLEVETMEEKNQILKSETNNSFSFCCLTVEQASRDFSVSLSAVPLSLLCLLLPGAQFPRAVPGFAYSPSPHSIVLRQDQADPVPVFPGEMEAQESQGVNPGWLPSGLHHKCGLRVSFLWEPHLEHCTHIWVPWYSKDMDLLEWSRSPFPIRKAEGIFSWELWVTGKGEVDKEQLF